MAVEINLFKNTVIKPLSYLGLTNSFFEINIDTLFHTWIGMAILFILAFLARKHMLKDRYSISAVILENSVNFFVDLCNESLGCFDYRFFCFVTAVFFFTLTCNIISLLPFVEEATKDLNTTLALGISCFTYVQTQKIKQVGLWGYIKSYGEPLVFLVPLEIVGKFSSIISLSFRLFGNILGGYIIFDLLRNIIGVYKVPYMIGSLITLILYFLASKYLDLKKYFFIKIYLQVLLVAVFFITGVQIFFGVFEGFIQAFVIAMLTLTYLSAALGSEREVDIT